MNAHNGRNLGLSQGIASHFSTKPAPLWDDASGRNLCHAVSAMMMLKLRDFEHVWQQVQKVLCASSTGNNLMRTCPPSSRVASRARSFKATEFSLAWHTVSSSELSARDLVLHSTQVERARRGRGLAVHASFTLETAAERPGMERESSAQPAVDAGDTHRRFAEGEACD